MKAGDRLIKKERDNYMYQLLNKNKIFSKKNKILDFGCGEGFIMHQLLHWGIEYDQMVGIDTSQERIKKAKMRFDNLKFTQITDKIPFSENQFTMIIISTVFSSIIGQSNRFFWASEIDRVLKGNGFIIFYDMKINNPFNFNTKKISKNELKLLFKNYNIKTKSLTVLPQLTRTISYISPKIYPFLTKLKFLHTHQISQLTRINN